MAQPNHRLRRDPRSQSRWHRRLRHATMLRLSSPDRVPDRRQDRRRSRGSAVRRSRGASPPRGSSASRWPAADRCRHRCRTACRDPLVRPARPSWLHGSADAAAAKTGPPAKREPSATEGRPGPHMPDAPIASADGRQDHKAKARARLSSSHNGRPTRRSGTLNALSRRRGHMAGACRPSLTLIGAAIVAAPAHAAPTLRTVR